MPSIIYCLSPAREGKYFWHVHIQEQGSQLLARCPYGSPEQRYSGYPHRLCVDGLKGFTDAIASVFPQATVQLCVVHHIRNSIKYVASKNQKEFMRDLKLVYQAVNKDAAEKALDDLEIKWGEDYPIVIKSWRDNRDRLTAYFQYSQHIRRIIYTTNTEEGFHRQLRKVSKNKGVFTSDTALEKLVYLVFTRIGRSGPYRYRIGGRRLSNWRTCSQTDSGSYPDNIFCLEFIDDIDNLTEPFWNIEGSKTAPKYNLTQFIYITSFFNQDYSHMNFPTWFICTTP